MMSILSGLNGLKSRSFINWQARRAFSSASENFYSILGLDSKASDSDIKTAYKKMAFKYHPDKGGNEEMFKKVSKAYEVLSDPQKRQLYDTHGENYENISQNQSYHGGHDPFEMFRDMFHGGYESRQPQTKPLVHELQLTLEEIHSGVTERINYSRQKICSACNGKKGKNPKTCSTCRGSGVITQVMQMGPMLQQVQKPCHVCNGQGSTFAPGDKCSPCGGTGTVRTNETLVVKVPAGIQDQEQIVFENKADESPGAITGDVIIRISEIPHSKLKRLPGSYHLIKEVSINLNEALTGCMISLPELSGGEFRATSITKNDSSGYPTSRIIQPGEIFKIPRRGINGPNGRGDLFLKINISFPKSIKIKDAIEGAPLKTIFNLPKSTDISPESIKNSTKFDIATAQEAAAINAALQQTQKSNRRRRDQQHTQQCSQQ